MLGFLGVFIAVSLAVLLISVIADLTDRYIGAKTWYRKKKLEHRTIQIIEKFSPLRPWKWLIHLILIYRKTAITIGVLVLVHVWLHLANPYASINFFESPYKTQVASDGSISYQQVYKPLVLADPVSDFLGYYRSGFLIAQNTIAGGKPIQKSTAPEIIDEIHKRRFDPSKPYLISGDQFSVLYPRNLGVFYNQLLDPNTAHSKQDWENRQRIYLQAALFAVDGLSVGDTPKTTLVPIAPRAMVTTRVHPGDVGSDAVYGTLYAIDQLRSDRASTDGTYRIRTQAAANQLLRERHTQLRHMVTSYLATVRDPSSGLIRTDIHLSSARDGASRKSSFYDNIVMWKTLALADSLGIYATPSSELTKLRDTIKSRYWNETAGYYNNDRYDSNFSSDWLLGYVTGFFDLRDPVDLERSKRTVAYVERSGLAHPLPIKYTQSKPKDMPWAVKTFVPNYGGNAIWSYWGAQYITLLADLHKTTGDESYHKLAIEDIDNYNKAIVRDGGFAETFNSDGQFLQSGVYKSIRITGWVVQFEHAMKAVQ